jgi:N-hydroxyarylamine O-acetyltransferase
VGAVGRWMHNPRVDDEDLTAYLRRLQLDAEPRSVDALHRLHRAHVERVPYETVWLHLGEPRTVDPLEAAKRIAHQGRGGYCFHVNGAFSELLRTLGYEVTRHVGGVHGPGGPVAAEMANHLVLTVAGLPSDENPEGTWYVDAGLGDALHEPLPLRAGEYRQGPFGYTLAATPGEIGDWHFAHDRRGSFKGMSWWSAPAEMHHFVKQHERLSTSPDSLFVQYLIVQRRDAEGVDIMLGLGLRRVDESNAPGRALTARAEWFAALADVFGLRFDGVEPAALDRLWQKTYAAHRAWEEKKSATTR